MLFFHKKSQDTTTNGFVAYEEIDSKRTSKLGYFFLILMVLFGVWQGNNLLSAVQNLATLPQQNSQCFSLLESRLNAQRSQDNRYTNYNKYGSYETIEPSNCFFSDREKLAGISDFYTNLYQTLLSKYNLSRDLSSVKDKINLYKNNRNTTVDEYSASLIEKIAKQDNPVLDNNQIRTSIQTYDDTLSMSNATEKDLTNKIAVAEADINRQIQEHSESITAVSATYTRESNVYQLKRFALSVLFVLPVFLFVWRRYSRSKEQRSEYAIIWGGIVAMVSLLLAQVLLVFIYQILPYQLLQKIFAFLSAFKFGFVILYWLGFILVPLFFGGLIYFIQKHYYNKQAIMARAFKANKCPACTMAIVPHMIFCPICGTSLKTKCVSCGNHTPEGGTFCEICGKKREVPLV